MLRLIVSGIPEIPEITANALQHSIDAAVTSTLEEYPSWDVGKRLYHLTKEMGRLGLGNDVSIDIILSEPVPAKMGTAPSVLIAKIRGAMKKLFPTSDIWCFPHYTIAS